MHVLQVTGIFLLICIAHTQGVCFFDGRRICENSITKHPITGIVRHCKDGALRIEVESDVRLRFNANFDCDWYGERYCHEDTITDLVPWWFLSRCRDGKVKIFPKPPQSLPSQPK